MKTTLWKIIKYTAAFFLSIVLICSLYINYAWFESLDPQGGDSAWCDSVKLPSVPNGSGVVVTAQNTVCSGFGGNSPIYVHIHKLNENENRENLVFRYFDKVDPLNIQWTSGTTVLISVNHVSQITKQLNAMEGVNIDYAIGSQDYQLISNVRKP
jgi:hypothetical protein